MLPGLVTCVCPGFTAGKNGESVGKTGGWFLNCCCICVPIVGSVCVNLQAKKTAEKAGKKLPLCPLCLETFCCMPCSICRTRREQMILGYGDRGYLPSGEQAAAALLNDKKMPSYETI